jgi:hypothetical protein
VNDDGPVTGTTDANGGEGGAATTSADSSPSVSSSAFAARSDAEVGDGSDSVAASGAGPGSDVDARPDGNGVEGRRFVVVLYLLLVAFAAVAGLLFARVVADPEPPRLLFLVPLPPTGLGFAVYGAVTVALVLGVPLALVVYVSRRADLGDPPEE